MSSPIQHKDQEATLVSTQDDLDKALPVDSSESGSSQSAGTTFVPDADEAIMSAAFVSMQDRRSRLTSLLHHLTVDPEAPDQELPIAGLPAVENAGAVTRRARTGWQFARLFVVTGVTAALIGWGMVLLPGDSRAQDDIPPLPTVETSRDQAQKTQLPQSVGSSQVLDADEIAALVKRGKDFANHGDLISARLLLRRAAEAGSAEAALALGETFDPVVFQRLHVIGIEPDAARAQKWYQRAAELGSAAASQHFAKPPSSQFKDEAKKTEIPQSSQFNDEAKKPEIPPSSQFNDEAKKTEIPPSSQLNDESVIKKTKATIVAKMSDPNSVEFEKVERAASKDALGNSIDTICGIVRDKNSGPRRFLYLVQTNEAYIGGYAVATSEYRNICSGK